MVSFGPRQRYLGESAKTQEVTNFTNTVGSLIRLLGRKYNDPHVHNTEARFVNAKICDVNGWVGVQVQYLGKEEELSSVQLAAMFLGKLRDTAARELKTPVSDIVISCPSWFTDAQRRALLDAAEIARLNPLRILNNNAAGILYYQFISSGVGIWDYKIRFVRRKATKCCIC